jgi:hypothetical protein
MTIKSSTGTRNGVAEAAKTLFDGGFILIFDGAAPLSANDEDYNNILCKISNNNSGTTGLTFEAPAANGAISKTPTEVWSGDVLVDGTATHYRFVQETDDGIQPSDTLPRIQGTVGVGGSGDLNMSTTAFTVGEVRTIDYFSLVGVDLGA